MDFKDFKDGLTSLSLVLFIFSLTFMLGSYLLQPYIHLEVGERDFIIILSVINVIFSIYYLGEAMRLEKVFKLEDQHIVKFGRRIGIITLIYSPHFFFLTSLFFTGLHNLQVMMVFLIFAMEGLLLGIVFKEVYDLLFIDEAQLKFDLDRERQMYLGRKDNPIDYEN